MSKEILVIGFLFLTILFLGNVSAADMCWVEQNSADCVNNNGKVVISLSDSTNAHGALAGQGTFAPVLCCNFGAGDTTCTADNKIIGLSSSTNAHAESPSLIIPNYAVSACYDSLKDCRRTDVSCGINEVEVLYISNTTNAHIEEPGLQSQNYNSKICCVVELPAECDLTSAKWQYEEVMEGTGTGAIVNGTEACYGEEISFEVFRGTTSCSSIEGCENPGNVIFGSGSNSVAGTWNASPYHDNKYHFVAEVVANPGETVTSSEPNLLVISECPYDPEPVICSDYTNENACNSNICGIDVQDSVPTGVDCNDSGINCECVWENNECKAGWGGLDNETVSEIGTCVYTQFTNDTCDDGFLTFSWTAEWIWDEECDATCQADNQDLAAQCVDGQKTVECPAQIPLPFFNIYSFIAALIIIALIYVILILRKEKRKR